MEKLCKIRNLKMHLDQMLENIHLYAHMHIDSPTPNTHVDTHTHKHHGVGTLFCPLANFLQHFPSQD